MYFNEAPTNNILPETRIDFISNNNGKRSNSSTGERPQRQDGGRGVQDARRYRTKLDAQGCPTILCVRRQVLRQGGDEWTCGVLGVLYPKLPGPLSAIQQFGPTSKNEMPAVGLCTIEKTFVFVMAVPNDKTSFYRKSSFQSSIRKDCLGSSLCAHDRILIFR